MGKQEFFFPIILIIVSQVYAENKCAEIYSQDAVKNLVISQAASDSDIKVFWIGANQSTVIILSVNQKGLPSFLYQRDENCEFLNHADKLNNCTILEAYLISDIEGNEVIYLSMERKSNSSSYVREPWSMSILDHGTNFTIPKQLPFRRHSPVYINPHRPWLLLLLGEKCSDSLFQAYGSLEYGQSWIGIMSNVTEVHWDPVSPRGTADKVLLYLLVNTSGISNETKLGFDLIRTAFAGTTLTIIAQNITSLTIQQKFIYAEFYLNDSRTTQFKVSTSRGRIWNNVQFFADKSCIGTKKKFLNSSQGVMFLHCGNEKGSLFLSDADGIAFTKVLDDHVDGNLFEISSMRGSYITKQSEKNCTFSVISFNQGQSWRKILCKDPELCYVGVQDSKNLLLLNDLVTTKSTSDLPVIMGTGTYNSTKYQGIYLSNDGGYTWKLMFPEHHMFYMSMHGSLMVTAARSPDFSHMMNYSSNGEDEWECQTVFKEGQQIIQALTGPQQRQSSQVAIISFVTSDDIHFNYTITVIDFDFLINRTCTMDDFLTVEYSKNLSRSECNLGLNETLVKINPNSRCLLQNDTLLNRKAAFCPCTRQDYECDFGFHEAPKNSNLDCIINHNLDNCVLDICFDEDQQTIVTTGYRKTVHSMCDSDRGWNPENYTKSKHLHLHCLRQDEELDENEHIRNAVIGVISMVILVALLSMAVFFLHKLQVLRRQTPTYRYSMLNQDENTGQCSTDDANETLVDISSDDESSPAKLLVESQTVFASIASNSTSNGYIPETQLRPLLETKTKSILEDTDDELLQEV